MVMVWSWFWGKKKVIPGTRSSGGGGERGKKVETPYITLFYMYEYYLGKPLIVPNLLTTTAKTFSDFPEILSVFLRIFKR